MRHYEKNRKGQEVGWWDDAEFPRTYHTIRDYKRREIFVHPKYQTGLGLDVPILERLEKFNITRISMQILNFEKKSFFIEIETKTFKEKGLLVNFDKKYGKQLVVSMKYFQRVYSDQVRLNTQKMEIK